MFRWAQSNCSNASWAEWLVEKIVISETVDANRWNQRILSMQGPMQLTTEWASFVCTTNKVHPLFLEGGPGDGSLAAIVYLSVSSKWPLSRWPSASTDCIPLARDREDVLADLELVLRRRGVREFQLNSYAYDGEWPIHLAPLGYVESGRYEFALSLDHGIDTAWRGTRPTLRNDIRRFERSGVVCHARSDHGVVSALYGIDKETALRHCAQGKQGTSMSQVAYDALWEILVKGGRAFVYLAEKDGMPIASVVIGRCGVNAYYIYGGATPEGLALNAPKGLLWFAIQAEYEHGVREFNLGGMPASAAQSSALDHGLYQFKTSFGATERSCISGRKVFRPILTTIQTGLRDVHRSIRDRSTSPV